MASVEFTGNLSGGFQVRDMYTFPGFAALLFGGLSIVSKMELSFARASTERRVVLDSLTA
jgi:hypothetical protein